jgi:hypothetical protein
MQMKFNVAAAEMLALDQPISVAMGCRNTPSAIIVPKPTQEITKPAATMIQP